MVLGLRRIGRGLIATVLLTGGCGSAVHPATNDGGTGGSGGTAPRSVSGGSSGSGGAPASGGNGGGTASGCAQDLSGTWDLVAETFGRGPRTGVLVLSRTTLSLQVGASLIYSAQPTQGASWRAVGNGAARAITISNTAASLNSGSIPLALGGAWTFAAGDEQCTANVGTALLTGICQGPSDYAGGSDWPYALANPNNGRAYTATRLSVTASQFGDLGGQWKTSASGGNGGNCTVTLAGNQVTTHCSGIVPFNGTMQLTIGSDCVASGMTGNGLSGSGFAISGQRR